MIIMVFVLFFQLVLTFGAPLGAYTMGGQHPGKLPDHLRMAAVIQAMIIVFFMMSVGSKSGLFMSDVSFLNETGMWIVFIYFILGTVLNWMSRSKKERFLWGPITTISLILSAILLFFNL